MTKQEEPFLSALAAGEVAASDIDTYIEAWHTSDTNQPLHVFLGFTLEEYKAWFRDPSSLAAIANSKRGDRGNHQER